MPTLCNGLAAVGLVALLCGPASFLAGCSAEKENPAQRAAAAQALFDQTTKNCHVPAATARGAEQLRLLDQAARGYEQLLRRYPEQSNLCAQALRGLGHVRAAQTNLAQALTHYAAVAQRYPGEDWEILQAWKSAADLLWDAGRRDEAAKFYRQIVERFDGTNQPPVVQLAVKGAKGRL